MEKQKSDKSFQGDGEKNNNCHSGKNQKVKLPPSPAFLIVLMGSLGDVTRGLCLVSQIKACFPGSSITWLIEPKCKEVVTFHPQIDTLLVFDRPNWKQSLKDLFNTLRTSHFDCVLDLQRHFKSGFFSFLSGAPCRIGFHKKNAKEFNWIFNNNHIPYVYEYYPKLFHYLTFTEFLGCPRPESLDFGFSGPRLLLMAADVLSKVRRPFIAIVLGTTWVSKEWFFDSYARLIGDLLKETSLHVVMVDTMAKYDMACELEKKTQSSRLINLVGKTSILELAAVFKEASVGVGPDCGSAHISAAVKTPYVTLFGPTSPERTAPYGSEDLVVSVNMACAPCYKRKCPQKDTPCMRNITVEDVKEKIFQGLNRFNLSSQRLAGKDQSR